MPFKNNGPPVFTVKVVALPPEQLSGVTDVIPTAPNGPVSEPRMALMLSQGMLRLLFTLKEVALHFTVPLSVKTGVGGGMMVVIISASQP